MNPDYKSELKNIVFFNKETGEEVCTATTAVLSSETIESPIGVKYKRFTVSLDEILLDNFIHIMTGHDDIDIKKLMKSRIKTKNKRIKKKIGKKILKTLSGSGYRK